MARKRRREGEPYKRESLVTVKMDQFQASLFAPQRLKELEETQPGILFRRTDDVIEERYIAITRNYDGVWEYEMEIGGVVTKIPAKLMERFQQQTKAIQKERKSDQARNSFRRIAKSDQRAAEREPTDVDVANFLGREV